VYASWGPGKYDPRYNLDGMNTPLAIPPAYGLAEVKNETYTAEGPISYWNAYVAVTQMGGQGNFSDPRLKIDVKHSPDMVSSKLPALRAYQHSLPAPPAPAGASMWRPRRADGRCSTGRARAATSADPARTTTTARCTRLGRRALTERTPPARQARRTAPPSACAVAAPPYFHDGGAATLADVVAHYNRVRALGLAGEQQRDLVEYLKSL